MAHRSYEKELLDSDHIPFSEILTMMRELNTINNLLGGHKITCKGVDHFIPHQNIEIPITIAEIGCGGGDNLLSIHNHLDKKKLHFRLTGIDIKDECIKLARTNFPADAEWICSDYRDVAWPNGKPDIIFSSLFCHHFTDEELVWQLEWLKENSNAGFFISDLHRHPLAYHSIRLLTKMFSRSKLIKNDAPLSVKRAFKKNDWTRLLSAAGISNYVINWHWAFRYLICVKNEQ